MFIERSKANVMSKIESGEYLPLSVWENRGWPAALIEEKCQEWVDHPELQIRCYKVTALSTTHTNREHSSGPADQCHQQLPPTQSEERAACLDGRGSTRAQGQSALSYFGHLGLEARAEPHLGRLLAAEDQGVDR